MFNKELKKLSRRELVDIIYQLKQNDQEKQEKIDTLAKALQEKRIRISAAGSIAEAAVEVTNIFSSAQTAADLYLHEISCMKEETEQECARLLEDARQKANQLLVEGQKRRDEMEARYQRDHQRWQQLQMEIQNLEQKADERVDQYEA